MHTLHFPVEHYLPSRVSSTRSEKKKPSSSSSSASTYSGKSTSSASSSSSAGTSTSTTRTKRHEKERVIDDGASITSNTTTSTVVSTTSSSSAGSSTSSSPAPDHNRGHTALLSVTGERVRHGNCPPDFLESYAHREEDPQVEIISGDEASTFFIKYLGDHTGKHASSSRSRRRHAMDDGRKVVFAISGFYYERELVDYYLTWRSKSKHQPALKESEIRLLDEEFKRVAKRIDEGYKASRRESGSNSGRSSRKGHRSGREHRERSRSPVSAPKQRKSRPPNLELPPPQAELPAPDGSTASSPEPPVSATSSVVSLPYLSMVRGVPLGHRVPLTVTNPDNRLSMVSEVDVTVVKSYGSAEAKGPVIAVIPPSARAFSSQFEFNGADHSSGLTPLMRSSASILSTETSSTRSSRSSNSSGGSPTSANAELDDPEREPTRFLIVLLGDRLEEGLSWHGIERQTSVRSNTSSTKERASPWSGPLARADLLHPPVSHHSKRRSLRSKHDRTGQESDEETHDGDTSWNEGPVVPLKPILETLGFMPSALSSDPNTPSAAYPYGPLPTLGQTAAPMSMQGTPYALAPGSVLASPAGSTMNLGYAASDVTPRMSMNGQYIPAWAVQARSADGSPLSRSDSRALHGAQMYAASPYLHPAY